jgi:2-hydroxy-3-keto-5-methylthiopentenyl-1-phosphate phosphatase
VRYNTFSFSGGDSGLEVVFLKYHVFVDFDGTVTVDDVGYNFFKHFTNGRAESVVQSYRKGEVGAVECLQAECDIYNEYPAPARDVRDFIDRQQVSDGFEEFIEYCRANNMKVTILSAGFDFYIKPILGKIDTDGIELYATPTFFKNGRIYPEFIRFDEQICPRCADCKGQRIKELKSHGETAVFIGDGHSDSHGAEQADIVFAKSFLAEHLKAEGIDYIRFNDFRDIIKSFQNQPGVGDQV